MVKYHFKQLRLRGVRDTTVLMTLPEKAEVFSICRRAQLHHLKLKTLSVSRQLIDDVVLYQIISD